MSTMAQRSASFQAVSASDAALAGVPRIVRPKSLNRNITAVSDAAYSKLVDVRSAASRHLARLTPRQNQVLDLIVAGYASKNIAFALGISQRTVENHRAAIAKLTGARSLAALVHIAVFARHNLHDKILISDDHATPSAFVEHRSPPTFPQIAFVAKAAEASVDRELNKITTGEIRHRVRNMFAVIQAISRQTMRHCPTKHDFDERFSARLSSLCRSLDCLIADERHGTSIQELVRSQLAPFGALDGVQISANGPELFLTPAATHNIGLALHELAANAVKYGSLSVQGGRVLIGWRTINNEGHHRFEITWIESNGPVVLEPTRRGFGRQMIEQLVALALGGTSIHEFKSTGVRWTLDAPESAAIVGQAKRVAIIGNVHPTPLTFDNDDQTRVRVSA